MSHNSLQVHVGSAHNSLRMAIATNQWGWRFLQAIATIIHGAVYVAETPPVQQWACKYREVTAKFHSLKGYIILIVSLGLSWFTAINPDNYTTDITLTLDVLVTLMQKIWSHCSWPEEGMNNSEMFGMDHHCSHPLLLCVSFLTNRI